MNDDEYIYVTDIEPVELPDAAPVNGWVVAQAVNVAWFILFALLVMPGCIAEDFDVPLLTGLRVGIMSAIVALMLFVISSAAMTSHPREP